MRGGGKEREREVRGKKDGRDKRKEMREKMGVGTILMFTLEAGIRSYTY